MTDPVIRFKLSNSNLSLSLYPDSRKYVYVQFEFVKDSGEIVMLSQQELCAEYLIDMSELSATAGYWIVKNCLNIKDEDGKHLYFKFREEGDPLPEEVTLPEERPLVPSWQEIGFYALVGVAAVVFPNPITWFVLGLLTLNNVGLYAFTTKKRS